MAQQALWPREFNRVAERFGGRGSQDGQPRKPSRTGEYGPTAAAGGSGNGSYHLSLLLEAPAESKEGDVAKGGGSSAAFDFVCSSSGVQAPEEARLDGGDSEGAVGFDRVCALRGEVVHIFTFFHRPDGVADKSSVSAVCPSRTTSVSLELEHPAERAAWNATASCVVIGDISGRLHFVTGDGAHLFSQPLAKPSRSSGSKVSGDPPRAFHCIKFATTAQSGRAGATPPRKDGAPPGGQDGEELLAVSASLQLFHFANVPIAAVEAACLAQDAAALKRLRASISVSMADATEPPHSSPQLVNDAVVNTQADACVQSRGGNDSRVFLVSQGGFSVWQRSRERGRRGGAIANTEKGKGLGGKSDGGATPGVSMPGKLVKVDGVPAGDMFGGGGAVSAELSADGRWIIIADSRGGLSWWDVRSLLRLGRWSWPGDTFNVTGVVILASNLAGVDTSAGPISSNSPGNATVMDGGDPRPCVACISRTGAVSVLKLGGEGAEELHRVPAAASIGVGGSGMLTVPSPYRHQFLLVSRNPASGKVGFYLGKEAVPRHRLQALLTKGDFDGALDLARAHSMDETDVHAARLLALLREGGSAAVGGERGDGSGIISEAGTLSPRFFEDVRVLFDRLDSPGALGRACEAAVRAPLPCLDDARKLLEVVENRLRSFDSAGTRVRNLMLERMSGVLTRLRTFELIEGGRGSSFPSSAVPLSSTSFEGSNAVDHEDTTRYSGAGDDGGESAKTTDEEGDDGRIEGDRDDGFDNPVAALADGGEDGSFGDASVEDVSNAAKHPGRAATIGDNSGEHIVAEVVRWLRFRTTDLVTFVGAALQAGDVQAASIAWRRHGRTERGSARPGARGRAVAVTGVVKSDDGVEGRRLEAALPGQLATLPAAAPCALLGTWLRDEVLPSLDVAGAMAVRDWAEHHAREVEALEKRPHGALRFAQAISEGSARVLGSAAELMSIHSTELAAAEATVTARATGLSDHWKPWKRDSLDALGKTLDDLAHAWDAHGLRLPLSKFERLPRDVVLFRVLDRVQSPEWLPEEISHHVMPLAKRYGLDPDVVLLDYMRICADAMVPRRGNAPGTAGATPGGRAVGASGRTTEQRAVAVARCMSAGEGCRSELRSKAVLALANAASFPFSEGLRELVQDALSWGGALDEELRRAATTLNLSQIVQRYHVTGFNLVDAARATRLLRHVLAQVHYPTALEDGRQVAQAYSHLHERDVYVEFLQNLAGSYPGPTGAIHEAATENMDNSQTPGTKLVPDTPYQALTNAHDSLGVPSGVRGRGSGNSGDRLAADLVSHRARVADVLRQLPPGDAMRVAEEVLLYLVRLLEDLELDAVTAGIKPGQLWGCKVSAGEDVGDSVGDAVVLDPGSEAEEAVLVAAAAVAVVAFLRDMQLQPGGSQRAGAVPSDLDGVANDLRRLSTLQTEFGAFTSLETLRRPHGRACWNVLREGLSGLEEHLHGEKESATGGSGSRKRAGVAPAAPRGGKKGGVAGETGKASMHALPRLLHRARRLSELLGIAWPSVVSHLANEAASRGKVPEAVGLCHMLFRDKAAMDERAAALALRDTAKALSTFVAHQAHSGALRADGQAGARARAAVLQAIAQSVRGLRQSAVLCDREELPLTMDLLQGSEAVAAVLRRCEGGDELEALMTPQFSSSSAALASNSSALAAGIHQSEWDADALAGLYKWYPGDGRVLPLEEALKLVSRFVRQEMLLRTSLARGDAIAAVSAPGAAGALAGAGTSTDVTLSSRWEAGLEGATSPLLTFLQGMGAQQLCLRVVAGMAVPPPSAVDVLGDSFTGLTDKVLEFNHIDCPLAIGYMLALPKRQAYDAFRRTIRYSSDDYGRLRTLARVGMYAARAWDNHDLLHQCMEVERDAHWWHVLTSLDIPFDNRGFSRTDRAQVPGEYQRSLVPALLERSGGDLALTVEFCDRYGVGEALPCLLFVEKQLGVPCISPHDVSYQESITEVLPSVHGVFLARLLRHMLETPGMIGDRDYERLAFAHGLLLSEKCQGEEEDSEEEAKRLEDSLEALAILKDYTSPWPLDSEGMPIMDGEDAAATPMPLSGHTAQEVYARRLPFMALLKDPWAVLEPQLKANSVAKLVPLADSLGLSVGDFYSRLVKSMLNPGVLEDGTPGPMPVFSSLQPWLDKIKCPAMACMTAQSVAVGMSRDVDRLEALRVAMKHAVAARSSHAQEADRQGGSPVLSLLPLPSVEGDEPDREDITDAGGVDSEEVEDLVDALEQRALLLEHLMTVKECLGDEMADQLSPYLSSSSQELLTKILIFAAESAAENVLKLPASDLTTSIGDSPVTAHWMARSSAGSISDFRARASRALRAARSVADQRGLDPHDLETLIMRLAKGWIHHPKNGAGAGPSADRGGGVFMGASMRGAGRESVFMRDAREDRMVEDATLALRAAFVLTVTFSDDAEVGSTNTSVCDSIVHMDLKSRISVLLAIARDGLKDGRGGRVKFRTRLRALLALSALAPSTLVAEVMASDKDAWAAHGEGLSSLSDLRRNVGYMSELEEARLPHKLEELAACPAEDIVRALRRDHRGERSLIPLMCDMLLDALSGDVGLWSPILADACRHPDLCRVLVMRVFPRAVRSTVADAFARSGATLAPSWEQALRYPLEELKDRNERRRKKEAAAAAAASVAPSGFRAGAFLGASSTSFGASLYAMGSGYNIGSKKRTAKHTAAENGADTETRNPSGDDDGQDEDVMAVISKVVLLLGACPFPERLDLAWFSSTLAGLGPRFHAQAIRVALFTPRSANRTAAVLEAIQAGGVAVTVALDELRPAVAIGIGDWRGGALANQATLDALFLDIDSRGAHTDVTGTRHFDAMASMLVRAGRARGVVAASLARGGRTQALALCRMHYSVQKSLSAGAHTAAGDGRVSAPRRASSLNSEAVLERFAEEFGLELPSAEG